MAGEWQISGGEQIWVDLGDVDYAPNMVIGGTYDDDKETIETDDFIYGSYNQNGSISDFTFNDSYIGGYSGTSPVEPTNKTASGNNLLDVIKSSSNNTTKAIGELTEAMNNVSKALDRSILSSDNISGSIRGALGSVVSQLASGNKISHTGLKLQNSHNEIQSTKNIREIERMDFEKNGSENLLDSDNQPIIPREAKARKDQEIGKDKAKENQVDYENLLDGFNELSDETVNNPDDIMSMVLKEFIDKIDVTKIDNGGA